MGKYIFNYLIKGIFMVIKIRCKKCGIDKPIYKFFKSNTCINGFNEYCDECIEHTLKNYM